MVARKEIDLSEGWSRKKDKQLVIQTMLMEGMKYDIPDDIAQELFKSLNDGKSVSNMLTVSVWGKVSRWAAENNISLRWVSR